MTPVDFSLVPFPGEESPPRIGVTGKIGRSAETLSIAFALTGNLSEIAFPPCAESPERKDRLWEGTCLEFFLGTRDSSRYWEFNLSPGGHWNIYRFTSYRRGMREERAIPALPFRLRTEPGVLKVSMDLELGKILPAGKAVDVAVCAVIRTITGRTSHWALGHPGPRPDFHRRDGFAIAFPAARGNDGDRAPI